MILSYCSQCLIHPRASGRPHAQTSLGRSASGRRSPERHGRPSFACLTPIHDFRLVSASSTRMRRIHPSAMMTGPARGSIKATLKRSVGTNPGSRNAVPSRLTSMQASANRQTMLALTSTLSMISNVRTGRPQTGSASEALIACVPCGTREVPDRVAE